MEKENLNTNNKSYKRTINGIIEYLKPHKSKLFLLIVLLISANTVVLLGPYMSGLAIDAMAEGKEINEVIKYSVFMALAYVGAGGLQYIMSRLVVRVAQTTTATMRQDTFNKIVELPISYIDTHQTGDLVSRISYDLNLVNQAINNDIVQMFASAITVIGSLVMMIRISPTMSLIFIILVPVTVLFTAYRIKKTRPLFSKRSKKLGEMNGYVEEILHGQKTISSYNKEDYFTEEFEHRNKDSMEAYYHADYQASINGPSVSLITNLSLALISMFGALLFLDGRVSIGNLTSFILYSRRFAGPINEMAAVIAEFQSALSAGDRVFKLLDEPSEPRDIENAIDLKNVDGEIVFNDINFSYEEDKDVIKDFSIDIKEGEMTAIVGPTGSGKSTIINLLMRFYDPQEGEILIDGIPIEKLTRKSLRDSFAMVLQDTWFFKGTIKENIAYGRPDASDEEIKKAAEAANIASFIENLPDGYDSIISDGAGNLSQGQKQLLSIARAMLIDAPMLILDEATSNVDSKTEIIIQEAMSRLIEGRTSLVIAHRLSTIKNADNIIVLVDGIIREEGSHEELMENRSYYRELYSSQFA